MYSIHKENIQNETPIMCWYMLLADKKIPKAKHIQTISDICPSPRSLIVFPSPEGTTSTSGFGRLLLLVRMLRTRDESDNRSLQGVVLGYWFGGFWEVVFLVPYRLVQSLQGLLGIFFKRLFWRSKVLDLFLRCLKYVFEVLCRFF